MKTSTSLSLAAVLLAALLASATAQNASDQTSADNNNNATNEPEQTATPPDAPMPDVPPDAPPMPMDDNDANDANAPATSAQPVLSKRTAVASITTADSVPMAFVPPQAAGTNADSLLLNFRNAPLDMVLNYLSDAAGFIIVLDTPVHGNVSVISSHPMTRDEAVDLLNSVLNKNGYAAIRDGRTLTIVDKDDAKTRDIPVKVSNDPDTIPKNAEIVTQIIPIRFVEARQLVSDLSSFVSPQATIVANEEGNSIVITDTQSNIRHLAEIIKAVDSSAEAETEIRVFRLKYANPTDVANLLGGIFPSSSSGSGTQSPIRFGGGGGGGGRGGFGGGGPGAFFASLAAAGAQSGSGQNQRVQKAQQVIAVADLRTSSVVVTAAKDLMEEIDGMIRELDVNSSRDQKVYVFHVDNADPQEALQVLQTMFPSTSTSSSRSSSSSSSQNSALMTREQNNATSTGASSSSSSSTSSGIGGAGGRSGGGGSY